MTKIQINTSSLWQFLDVIVAKCSELLYKARNWFTVNYDKKLTEKTPYKLQ
jgi:hypothetical protein